jgi:hypothetical protein
MKFKLGLGGECWVLAGFGLGTPGGLGGRVRVWLVIVCSKSIAHARSRTA